MRRITNWRRGLKRLLRALRRKEVIKEKTVQKFDVE